MKPKPISIPCSGYSVVADWYEGTPDKLLLVLPGYSSNRKRFEKMITTILNETGGSALALDYTGHGDSPFALRDTRPAQHFLEVIMVFDWLVERYPDAKITVLGSSYGGFMATQLTKYREFSSLVLIVPAIYKPESFYDLWAKREDDVERYREALDNEYRTDADALAKHPLLARASRFKKPVLVVVHENDEQVPKQTTDAYINAFGADSFTESGWPHTARNDPSITDSQIQAYFQKIAAWLAKA